MRGRPETLKAALYNTIHQNRKKVETIAEELGMGASYLARAALPDEDMLGAQDQRATGVRFPLKQLVPLIRATGDTQVLNYICHSVGLVALPIPQETSSLKSIQKGALKASAEFGDLMREISKSCDDNILSRPERERIHKEGWEAITAIMQVIIGCEEE